ncbi:coiled-coil domain-containing protein 33-like isoform X2 [Xenia sp. Carnegie-2017]|uniref:coiled-coil domain-containing protein 33-like isoform X2 n=1 Tax=Xenia sp. Carnegie-2017 TaxID=2897299 RepID=UPI001F037246|nr:coiled-coil domain-containing protein 33-like isoform X2 [Xenia sp. Carnegie-2017]
MIMNSTPAMLPRQQTNTCHLDYSDFRFEMPKEFSEGEIELLFECFQLLENPFEESQKCGEGTIVVYPCAQDVPQDDLPSTSSGVHTCYDYTTQIPINKLLVDEGLYVNIAHVKITLTLKIVQEDNNYDQQADTNVACREADTQVKDAALPGNEEGPSTRHACGSYLSDRHVCEIIVHVHSACDLPSNMQGRPPQPYVSCKMKNESTNGIQNLSTHCTQHPTYSPCWDQLVVVKTSQDEISRQVLVINITDYLSQSLITNYCLQLLPFEPFRPYHLELEQTEGESKAKLFITLLVKLDELNPPSLASTIFGLEVVLRKFSTTVGEKFSHPLIASIVIVNDSRQYRMRYVNNGQVDQGFQAMKLKVPFVDIPKSAKDDVQCRIPQVTFTSSLSSDLPKWNQTFFFSVDDLSLFAPSSALVIEYFNALQVVSFGQWRPRSPIGYSILDLDEQLRHTLENERASMGVCVNNISVYDSSLQDQNGSTPTVDVILRLISSKRPDPMISEAHFHILPVVDMATKCSTSPLKRSAEPLNHVPRPFPVMHERNPLKSDAVDSTTFSVMESQTKELEKHRFAMKKMADDILKLKSEASRLQAANSRLRLQLENDHLANHTIPFSGQLEGTTHGELVQRIVIIKGSLDEQTVINRELRLEIRSLQNQIIKKNEKEKEFYKLQEAHKNQQMLLHKLQEKLRRTKTVEETCKRQEKVILRLEDLLANSKMKDKDKKKDQVKTAEETLLDENKRLRTLVSSYEKTNKTVKDMEKLQMHEKLRVAESRVSALEKELLDNARKWARDKAELQLKLSENHRSHRDSSLWQHPNHLQENYRLFERTPPDSLLNDSGMASPKLNPLSRK